MAEIRPFQAVRPAAEFAAQIAALPYDVVSRTEAGQEVEREPLSFLSIDLPQLYDGQTEDIYGRVGELLQERIREGYFIREAYPCYYLYEQSGNGRSQTGIGALTRVDDYRSGVIRRHENTRADKEADRIAHVQACQAQTGPIFLTYRTKQEIRDMTAYIQRTQEPLYDFVSPDGIRHRIWRVSEEEMIERFYEAFETVKVFYIADGHHRCAAAAACAMRLRQQNPSYTGEEPWNFILSVLFPDEELRILDYNRVVKDRNGLTQEQFLQRLEACFTVKKEGPDPVRPSCKGMFGMYLSGQWYTLCLREEYRSPDPVEGLDVSRLQTLVLAPVLGIREPRTDKRIDFVGGIRGTDELKRRADETGGVAFWLYPTSLEELFAVADAGRLMPPKSTWFEPKLRSGLLINSLTQS